MQMLGANSQSMDTTYTPSASVGGGMSDGIDIGNFSDDDEVPF